jgi:cell division septum initiation protein DivIVA
MLRIGDMTSQTFATTRRGEGYDIGEVDKFRAEVAEVITAREMVIDRLRDELDARRRELDVASTAPDPDSARREASGAAARLLEIATVNADVLVNDARSEAESLVGAAHAEAEQLRVSSRAEAQRLDAELTRRHEQEVADLERHRASVLAELDEQRAVLEAQVEALRQMESEHRERLRRHFTEHLARLDEVAAVAPQPAVAN